MDEWFEAPGGWRFVAVGHVAPAAGGARSTAAQAAPRRRQAAMKMARIIIQRGGETMVSPG
jgi:hypothetical protein